jgi:hypothetical protein
MRLILVLVLLQAVWATVPAPDQAAAASGEPRLVSASARDTIQTNLWLVEALMGQVVTQAAASLPPAPAAIMLLPQETGSASDLFGIVAARLLQQKGYQLYAAEDTLLAGVPEPPAAAAVDCEFRYKLEEVSLDYPDVGRRLGIWRQWVARDLVVAALVKVVETKTGRLLLNDRIQRAYRDRVASRHFEAVRSDLYDFTDAKLQESGWRRRLEEFVVLGTLAGLVAIYFANTGS